MHAAHDSGAVYVCPRCARGSTPCTSSAFLVVCGQCGLTAPREHFPIAFPAKPSPSPAVSQPMMKALRAHCHPAAVLSSGPAPIPLELPANGKVSSSATSLPNSMASFSTRYTGTNPSAVGLGVGLGSGRASSDVALGLGLDFGSFDCSNRLPEHTKQVPGPTGVSAL
jgi:hypothetical protein